MKENGKPLLIGLAVIVLLGFSYFMYKKSTPNIQSPYNAQNGPPAYVKNRDAATYGSSVGKGTTTDAPDGRPSYAGPGGGYGRPGGGGPPSYGGPGGGPPSYGGPGGGAPPGPGGGPPSYAGPR